MSHCITISWATPEELREKLEAACALFVECDTSPDSQKTQPETAGRGDYELAGE